MPLAQALRLAPARMPASSSSHAAWRQVSVNRRAGTVTRPAGVRLDSSGIAKGLFGDVLASVLAGHSSYAVEAAGDIRFGGAAGLIRPVQVTGPFDEACCRRSS